MLLLFCFAPMRRLAIKNSNFKRKLMVKLFLKSTLLFVLLTIVSCGNSPGNENLMVAEQEFTADANNEEQPIIVGANRTESYLPLLENKKVGVVGNQSSVIFLSGEKNQEQEYVHLVDSLISLDVNVVKVFAPEHGFRGTADAGEIIKDGVDIKTGVPVLSLYGNNKKPSEEQLEGIDVMVFDIQDVGTRFYTYISTLHYVMEACAENNIPLVIFDRPNPNGHYVDGPILKPEHKSFVGMHPVPIVHGLTIGEYAKMVNGEKFLEDGIQTDLTVIEMENYNHARKYKLPIKPSPNLPNAKAINLYPSLCFFEGTNVNAGRGTSKQFQVFGSPYLDQDIYEYSYIPKPNEGSKYPKHNGEVCYGKDLIETPRLSEINLEWLVNAYHNTADKSKFFNAYFTKLAGTEELRHKIESGMTAAEIKESWQPGLEKYKKMREDYLLYE